MTTEMMVRAGAPLEFSDEQRKMIRDAFANGASEQEFSVLMEVAKARRLNPLMRQIHFVSRWDSQKSRNVWATQVSIDGLRAIAERTGIYAGQDEPEFVESSDGIIKCCKVRVYRKDWGDRAAVGVAYWSEYVQTYRDKSSGKDVATPMWRKMPHVMIAKCAEAIALRKAFPEDMSGLYTPDEMAQADNDRSAIDADTLEPAVDAIDVPRGRRPTYPAAPGTSPTQPAPAIAAALRGIEAPARIERTPADALRDDVLEQIRRAETAEAVVDVWIAAREECAATLGAAAAKIVKGALRVRVSQVMQCGADEARAWLTRALSAHTPTPPDDGTNGPSKPRRGIAADTAADHPAANDGAPGEATVCLRDGVAMTAAEFVQHLASKRHPAALRASVMAHAASLSDDAVALYAARYRELAYTPHDDSRPTQASAMAWVRAAIGEAVARDARRAA